MAYTNDDLAYDVLVELQKLAGGQSPAAEDVEIITRRLDGVFSSLASRNIIQIASDDIDPGAYDALVRYVAQVMAPAFGEPQDDARRLMAEQDLKTVACINGGVGGNLQVDLALTNRNRRRR